MRSKLLCVAGGLWLVSACSGLAVERFVPSGGALNYPTIQDAITASVAGDVVRVQPGIYTESITFRSPDITLTSLNPADSNVVQSTVIQGNGMQSVVTFTNGQSTNTVFTGFTVRGGGGNIFSGSYLAGGGIYCYQSNPSIVRNIIEENYLPIASTNASLGGGVFCWGASPRIVRNIIRNNSATIGGAIISVSGKPLIGDNWIHHNVGQSGGACYFSDEGTSINNTFAENTPDNLYVDATRLVVNNIISNFSSSTGVIAGISTGDLSTWFQYNDVWEPDGVQVLLMREVGTNVVETPISVAGTNGNLSVDPLFVNITNDLHLTAASLCINAGDLWGLRSTNEVDLDGAKRVYALRVDMGANEFSGIRNYPPLANAGPDRVVYWDGQSVALDGSGSVDPDGDPLNFAWVQTGGSSVTLQVTNANAYFVPAGLGEYRFDLSVNDGEYDSPTDSVRVIVTNLPPIASAGFGQSLLEIPATLVLDGSHSLDPEGKALVYHWQQTGGPSVALSDPQAIRPSFSPAGAGVYEFELTVNDAFHSSPPDRVTFYLGAVPPVANAGPTKFAGRTQINLDGSGSFAPNSTEPLEYSWRLVSGPSLILSPTNVVNPVVRGFAQLTIVREAVFELVVRAGGMTSAPSQVKMVIVPAWGNTTLNQVNPPFNTNRPTVIAFSGGNCDTGNSVGFPSSWLTQANLYTGSYSRDTSSSTADPRYFGYGDQLIVLLSSNAPAYDQPIQTLGISTGCMPACDVADRFNVRYKDPRYQVNRITFLDTGCSRDYNANITSLKSNRMAGKQFWIDNYYSAAVFRNGTLNVQFPVPPADHGTPSTWYFPSWTIGTAYRATNFNSGVFAGAFFSVIGPGKNYQLETGQSEYHFGWNPPATATFPVNSLIQMQPTLYPARLPGVVELIGPTNGTLAAERKIVFSCQPVTNAVRYQILMGREARQLNAVAWEGSVPPTQPVAKLPYGKTWWTIRAIDAYGTTSDADARLVLRDSDRDGATDEAEVLTYHTDPDNADTDGDGHLDGQEVLAGADPLRPDLEFVLNCRLVSTNQVRFSWFSDAGKLYDLEASWTMMSWQRIQTFSAPAGGGLIQYTVPLLLYDTNRFFRVRSYPPGP